MALPRAPSLTLPLSRLGAMLNSMIFHKFFLVTHSFVGPSVRSFSPSSE